MAIWSTHEKKAYHKMRIKHRRKWQVGVSDWGGLPGVCHPQQRKLQPILYREDVETNMLNKSEDWKALRSANRQPGAVDWVIMARRCNTRRWLISATGT